MENDINYLEIGLQVAELGLQFIEILEYTIRRRKRCRRWWSKPVIRYNYLSGYSGFTTVYHYFKMNDEEEFVSFTRMRIQEFEYVYSLIRDRLVKRSIRPPLPPELRFSLTLQYLAHCDSIRKNKWFYNIDFTTVYNIIPEVCSVICEVLTPIFVKFPTQEEFQIIANEFMAELHFPNCVGAVDGRHCRILKPRNSGSLFFNYTKFYSIVLMACCDAKKRFIWASIGDYGSLNDAGIFANSNLGHALSVNEIDLPLPVALHNTEIVTPFFLIGDGGFPMKSYLMKPFLRNDNLSMARRAFNYRLSHVRRIIESTFGELSQKWLVNEHALAWKLSRTEQIIMSTVCLHNILIDFKYNEVGNRWKNNVENVDHRIIEKNEMQPYRIREELCEYFISPAGSVPWQWARM